MQMGMGSPGQVEVNSELCANFDLEAPIQKIKLVHSEICCSAPFKYVSKSD